MPRLTGTTCAVLSLGVAVAGCQTAPARYAGQGMHATYAAAATGAGAVRTTSDELYHGAGKAVRAPLHDLNMMQDKIAPVLLRAEDRPYDLSGVNSCGDVLNRVSELDLALGPDVDTPKEHKKRARRGADFAADAALDAAGSAAEHFIPMRGTIKQLTGATRYENHVKHASLAGTTRRSFLKAVGMAHNCTWPAAPLDFRPAQIADVDAPWLVQYASTAASPSLPGAASQSALTSATLASPTATMVVAASPPPAAEASRVVLVSAVSASRPGAPVFIPVSGPLALPSAAPPAVVAGQAWRPAARAYVVPVSAPITTTAALAATPLNTSTAQAAAPWGAGFSMPAARP